MHSAIPSSWRLLAGVLACAVGCAQTPGALKLYPNLIDNIDRPLRYRPDGADFVIENGPEFFNRPLYGGDTAFRVDGGDKPEFVLYLPGRGGNLRLGVRAGDEAKWLQAVARITMRYRPGELLYEIRDPLLGPAGVLTLAAVAYEQTEGLALKVGADGLNAPVELCWAYGGVNGQRGARDGDIGTERVPISEWFQFQPAFCIGNTFELAADHFTLRARPATIVGVVPEGAQLALADAEKWTDLAALWASTTAQAGGAPKVVVGRVRLENAKAQYLSLQRVGAEPAANQDLSTYREVTAPRKGKEAPPVAATLAPAFTAAELPDRFAAAERYFADLRSRVGVDTPDAFFNAAVGALNVAAEAVWDETQHDIMHGAIAWRTRLLGWRGPYALDALGWHDRARRHFEYWASRQNTDPIPENIPPPDEKANLARNEAGLHTNGDMSNSHYDMNLVYIDALFRHLRWTGDMDFARKLWPVIARHLAWERRLFRREFGPEKFPLYEAYAAIWASDDLQYSGGGAMHATAYNYFHNRQAAQLARLLGADPTIYQREAQQLERSMRALLWLERDGGGWFAEAKDWLGAQNVHPSAALWTFYHTLDSEVPTPQEAWLMTEQVERDIPHLPVRGPGVPAGLYTLATSNWMPYDWSINNVVMGEAMHGALGFWQAGRADEAWKIMKGSLLAAMYMGISPGNVGSMSYLDVYRRESQRDFADGSGVLSRAVVEGLFGVKPDALAGELRVAPGWPAEWEHATLRHPDFSVTYQREGARETYEIEQKFAKPLPLRLELTARQERIERLAVDGAPLTARAVENAVGQPRMAVFAPATAHHRIVVQWAGAGPAQSVRAQHGEAFVKMSQGQMRWWKRPAREWFKPPVDDSITPAKAVRFAALGAQVEPVDLTSAFNDRVTQIFKNEYRAPRSPFVSLALPKQGIGGWAGGVNATAEIDDTGLQSAAAKTGGRIILPDGTPLMTPTDAQARNVVFVSQWKNYPPSASVPLGGHGHGLVLLMAGSTNPMQSRIENGQIVVAYGDGTTETLPLVNPTTWWPIEQDYFVDDFQFRLGAQAALPLRVDLKTGAVRTIELPAFKGKGGRIPGGAASVLQLPLQPEKELKSLTVRATANDVVIGLMAVTVVR